MMQLYQVKKLIATHENAYKINDSYEYFFQNIHNDTHNPFL